MEKIMGDLESKNLVNELIRGKDLARQLQMHLNNNINNDINNNYNKSSSSSSSSSHEITCEYLVQKILVSFEKAISMLTRPNTATLVAPATGDQLQPPPHSGCPMSESPPNGSPKSDQDSDRDQENRDFSKKRKSFPRWKKQVRVNPGVGLEGPLDDGFSWRKYGQKDILGANHPRGYYRCTNRNVQGCLATKQVQRSDDDPTIFDITYRGTHTCNQSPNTLISQSQEPIINQDQNINMTNVQRLDHDHMLSNFKSGLRVITEGLNDNHDLHDLLFNTSSVNPLNDSRVAVDNSAFVGAAISPMSFTEYSTTTSYLSDTSFQNPNSVNFSAENVGNNLDFPFGHVDDQLDPNFTFDHSKYF